MAEQVFFDLVYPFWFADTALLAKFFLAEINTAAQLLADRPNMRAAFDTPDAELSQRKMCFELLAHRKLIEVLDDSIVARHEMPPSLNDLESRTLLQTSNLVPDDAPEWARDMQRVVHQIPLRIVHALPGPLQTQGYYPDNEERHEAVRSATTPLSTVEQLQELVKSVLDQQWRRLEQRCLQPVTVTDTPSIIARPSPKKRKRSRTANKLGARRDQTIAEIDDISQTVAEFLRIMDERGVQPQPTWAGWPRSWVEAYKIPRLRKLIHQDKSRAIARWRDRHNR